jgi:hypothetical protein
VEWGHSESLGTAAANELYSSPGLQREWNIGGMVRGRENPKYSGRSLSQYNVVSNKYLIDRPGIEAGPPRWEACDWPFWTLVRRVRPPYDRYVYNTTQRNMQKHQYLEPMIAIYKGHKSSQPPVSLKGDCLEWRWIFDILNCKRRKFLSQIGSLSWKCAKHMSQFWRSPISWIRKVYRKRGLYFILNCYLRSYK